CSPPACCRGCAAICSRRRARAGPTTDRSAEAGPSARHGLERRRLEPVALEQLVELGAVAPGEPRRLRDVARGDLQQLHEVVVLEAAARLLERGELPALMLDRVL